MDTTPSPREIQHTYGILYDGFVLSMIGCGFTFFQTYVYFLHYPSDHWSQKSFVAIIFSLDTASAVLVSKSIYFYMVTCLPYIEPLGEFEPSLNAHILLSAITIFGVQLFYSFRIWKLSRNIWVTGITILLSMVAFVLGIAMVVTMFQTPVFAHLASFPLRVVFPLACSFIVLAYLSMFIGFTKFSKLLSPRPMSFPEWFDTIFRYMFTRGLIVMMVQLACLVILVIMPHKVYWVPLYIVATKLSTNVALLNSRQTFRGKGVNEGSLVDNGSSGSRLGNFTGAPRFAPVSDMFNTPESSAVTVEITRTIEFDRTIHEDSDSTKGVYTSDHRSDSFQASSTAGDVVKPTLLPPLYL
ncbi:hypothetical protein B0H14DRAFT_3871900 [Mycena olivaceomarginata]|nr:hypothetical protein B0H14DRAFT_3871900 [Mycena olivaceomarginata]